GGSWANTPGSRWGGQLTGSICPAIWLGCCETSKLRTPRTPHRPANRPAAKSAEVLPRGVARPAPGVPAAPSPVPVPPPFPSTRLGPQTLAGARLELHPPAPVQAPGERGPRQPRARPRGQERLQGQADTEPAAPLHPRRHAQSPAGPAGPGRREG